MKNQPPRGRGRKVAAIPWLPPGTHQIQVAQYIFKQKPTRLQLVVQLSEQWYRTTIFYPTAEYAQVMLCRKNQKGHLLLTIAPDPHGTHVTAVHLT